MYMYMYPLCLESFHLAWIISRPRHDLRVVNPLHHFSDVVVLISYSSDLSLERPLGFG